MKIKKTPEWRAKISATLKGRKIPKEQVERMKISLKKTFATGKRIQWNKGKKMSLAYRKKLSEIHKGKKQNPEWVEKRINKLRGKNHWNWKGGIYPESEKIRKSTEYKLWRIAVFERDNYACIWCGKGNANGVRTPIQADHIKPFAFFPELRFAIDNGRTLCIPCHKLTNTYLNRWSKNI